MAAAPPNNNEWDDIPATTQRGETRPALASPAEGEVPDEEWEEANETVIQEDRPRLAQAGTSASAPGVPASFPMPPPRAPCTAGLGPLSTGSTPAHAPTFATPAGMQSLQGASAPWSKRWLVLALCVFLLGAASLAFVLMSTRGDAGVRPSTPGLSDPRLLQAPMPAVPPPQIAPPPVQAQTATAAPVEASSMAESSVAPSASTLQAHEGRHDVGHGAPRPLPPGARVPPRGGAPGSSLGMRPVPPF